MLKVRTSKTLVALPTLLQHSLSMGIGARIKLVMEARGKLPVDIAEHFNISESAVSQWFAKDSGPKRARLPQLAEFMDTTVDWLLSDEDVPPPRRPGTPTYPQPGAPPAEPAPADQRLTTTMQSVPMPPGRPDVPVWASAEAGVDGAMVLVNDPIDYIRRSERMQNVKAPFAFYVIGTSMSPSIEHGDQVVINPALQPIAGKDHVFLQTKEDGTILALVKRLVRSAGTVWRVRQFNPPKDYDLPKAKWTKALVIAEKRVV